MANIFSRFLAQFREDDSFSGFVAYWDRLELLVLLIYRRKSVGEREIAEWQQVRPWLLREYPRWQAVLARHWAATTVGGRPASEDPFLALLSISTPHGYVNNWRALQTLPAARETINQYLRSEQQ